MRIRRFNESVKKDSPYQRLIDNEFLLVEEIREIFYIMSDDVNVGFCAGEDEIKKDSEFLYLRDSAGEMLDTTSISYRELRDISNGKVSENIKNRLKGLFDNLMDNFDNNFYLDFYPNNPIDYQLLFLIPGKLDNWAKENNIEITEENLKEIFGKVNDVKERLNSLIDYEYELDIDDGRVSIMINLNELEKEFKDQIISDICGF